MDSANFGNSKFTRTYSDDYVNNSFNNSKSQSAMRRNISRSNLIADRVESKVLVIYTGGTIGMMRNEKNGKCNKTYSNRVYRLYRVFGLCHYTAPLS